jgi:hypothetical protein
MSDDQLNDKEALMMVFSNMRKFHATVGEKQFK